MRTALTLLLLVLSTVAFGDGKIFASTGELPNMPSQRALLAWKEGVETLVVESDFNGYPGTYIWLIPVPGKPDKIEALEPGLLETLELTMPIVVIRPDLGIGLLSFVGCILALFMLRERAKLPRGRWALQVALLGAILAALFGIFFPVFAQAGSGGGPRPVGRYDIAILTTPLTSGLPDGIPKELVPTVNAYIDEGWSIVAAKLQSNGSGVFAPHPLKITFRSDEPIYPMRLTGVEATALHLDIYVIGDTPVTHPILYQLSCKPITSEGVGREERFAPLDHPDAVPYLREGRFITRLSGMVKPDQMHSDFKLSWAHNVGPPVTVLDPDTAWLVALTWLLGTVAIGALLLGFIAYRWTPTKVLLLALLPAIGATILMTAFQPRYQSKLNRPRSELGMRLAFLQKAVEEASLTKTAQDAEKSFRAKIARGNIPERAVPGGFTVSRTGTHVSISTYNRYGTKSTTTLPKPKPGRDLRGSP